MTGSDSFIMKVAVGSVVELQTLIDRMTPYVATTTLLQSQCATGFGVPPVPSNSSAIHFCNAVMLSGLPGPTLEWVMRSGSLSPSRKLSDEGVY